MRGADPLTTIVLALLLVAALAVAALGAPPPGTDLNSAEHAWWQCHMQPSTHISCCSEADGHSLTDSEWQIKPPSYRVLIEGQWYDVPVNTILPGDDCGPDPDIFKQSESKVWYVVTRGMDNKIVSVIILCFAPGTLY